MTLLKLLVAVAVILISALSVLALYVVPQFTEMFESFGDDLPLSTQIILASYKYWLFLLIIPVFIYMKFLTKTSLSKKLEMRLLFVLIPLVLTAAVSLPLLVVALYQPIYQLAA